MEVGDTFSSVGFVGLHGLERIVISGDTASFTLRDSNNPDANLSISGGTRANGSFINSHLASITGSDGVETVVVRDGSFVGDVSLGGGNDSFVVEHGSLLTTAITSLDGGTGDEDELIYLFPEASISDSLANVTGFEQLLLSPPFGEQLQPHTFSNISGFDLIFASSSIFGGNVNAADIVLLPGADSDLSDTILGGAPGGSFTISQGLTAHSFVFYDPRGGRPDDHPARSALLGATIINEGIILNEVDFGNGDDLYDGRSGTAGGPVTGGAGIDALLGGAGSESFFGGLDADTLNGGGGNDLLDGGSNIDTAVFAGALADYTITQTQLGVFEVVGPDGTDTLSTIEFAQFDDETVRLLPGQGVSVNFQTADPSLYQDALTALRDFDGNALGGDGAWLRIGEADVNGDGDIDQILVNDAIGRFATVGTADDGLVYFDDFSWAGETRVAGIYLDPLVQSGDVEQGSPFDSQQRFQNDLAIENINRVLGADDYDGDGLQEVYFALTDGTAFLRAIMEADG
ncbi:hypothetical protein MWU38_07645, partial [Qipengyuania sp. S6317L1]|nr:hypothetical protein [Qipengyuania sp. S6317L1]